MNFTPLKARMSWLFLICFSLNLSNTVSVRFAFLGDWGVSNDASLGATTRTILRRAEPSPFDFIVLGGDNFYETGVTTVTDPQIKQTYRKYFDPISADTPRCLVLGNHDYFGNPIAQILYSQHDATWNLEYYYYDRNFQSEDTSLCAVFLDTERINQAGQIPFLKHTLARPNCKRSDFIIVFGHHPLYSRGGHGDSRNLQSTLEPVFTEFDVDAYISGHDHLIDIQINRGVYYIVSGASAKKTTASWYTSKSMADTPVYTSYGHYGYASFYATRDSLQVDIVNSETGAIMFSHSITSKRPIRTASLDRIITDSEHVMDGIRPWDSHQVIALSFIVIAGWIFGIGVWEPQKFAQIFFPT